MEFFEYPPLPDSVDPLFHGSPFDLEEGGILKPNDAKTHYGKPGKYVFASAFKDWAAAYGFKNFGSMSLWPVNMSEREHWVIVVLATDAPFKKILEKPTSIVTIDTKNPDTMEPDHSFRSSYPYAHRDRYGPTGCSSYTDLVLEGISEEPITIKKVEIVKKDDLIRNGMQLLLMPPDLLEEGDRIDKDIVLSGLK